MPANAASMAPGGGAAGALSALRRSWSSSGMGRSLINAGARPSNLVQLQLQAAVRVVAVGHLEPGWRQLDAALEMPVRDLQPVNLGVSDFARQRCFPADDQHAGAERPLDSVELVPGERDQDGQRIIALEDVARRLPGSCRAAAVEKLPIKALGAFHRLT